MSGGMQCATAYCIIIGMIYVALHTVLSLGVRTVALYAVSCPGIHNVLLLTVSFVWGYVE